MHIDFVHFTQPWLALLLRKLKSPASYHEMLSSAICKLNVDCTRSIVQRREVTIHAQFYASHYFHVEDWQPYRGSSSCRGCGSPHQNDHGRIIAGGKMLVRPHTGHRASGEQGGYNIATCTDILFVFIKDSGYLVDHQVRWLTAEEEI